MLLGEEFALPIINTLTMSVSNIHQTNIPFKLVFFNIMLGGVMQKFATKVDES